MNNQKTEQYSDEALIENWPGFVNNHATVNGVRLHFVEGGSGADHAGTWHSELHQL